jgi:hypothetical protein
VLTETLEFEGVVSLSGRIGTRPVIETNMFHHVYPVIERRLLSELEILTIRSMNRVYTSGGPEVRTVKLKLPNVRYVLNFFLSLKKVLFSELNARSQSVLPIIQHVLERLQRDFIKNIPDRSNPITWSSLVRYFPSKYCFR